MLLHLPSFSSATQMARCVPRAALISSSSFPSAPGLISPPKAHLFQVSVSTVFVRGLHATRGDKWRCAARPPLIRGRICSSQKGERKVRRQSPKIKEKEVELDVSISIEEASNNPKILRIAELLRLDAPAAVKLAFDGLKDSVYKTRDNAIGGVAGYESVELSVLLCDDKFIRKLNKEWRGEDHATDVISMSQHVPDLKLPMLMLGDIVISVETAARQAEQRGHTLLDEIRILAVHGLLHLLGFDHEVSKDAEVEMEKEEDLLLKSLGWKGKGLIQSAYDAEPHSDGVKLDDRKKEGSPQYYKQKFRYIFCDMDGTLLNSKSQLSSTNIQALKEASSRGVKIVIATGKARPAVIRVFKEVDLTGKDGIVSEFSPGVFLQGLLVYGTQGREIFRMNLDTDVCREACRYSLENEVPLIAFTEDRCLSLYDHPLVDSMHTVYHEQKAEIMPSVEHLVAAAGIQKLVFMDTAEGVTTALRPYWSEATGDSATVVQTVPDMLEIVPPGTSKGRGVNMLLDHLGVTPREIMAIGDGENDIEMLELASLGIALSNGAEKAKAVANVIGLSNDEDGVADAIYRYAL
ncbi:endoribonuclease YBEY, chloroplastic-like [Pyrus communis]|uniref:endoribonuclease YBEY, chloroplastic-like n=1 Tax=Pyrus communis TaxID=23211 RepID=UPI0035C0F40F